MSDSQAFVTPIARGLIRGYREQISGAEYVTTDPTKSTMATLLKQATDASLAIIYGQDGESPRKLTLEARQSLYASEQE